MADRANAAEFEVTKLADRVNLLFKREGLVDDNAKIAHCAGG